MILATVFNAILAVGVTVMVVAPLVWAILNQHRDHVHGTATDGSIGAASSSREHHRVRPPYKPVPARG
jgi:hypothetical protein